MPCLATMRFTGSMPISELLAWLDEADESGGTDQFIRAARGRSLAKLGRLDEARAAGC